MTARVPPRSIRIGEGAAQPLLPADRRANRRHRLDRSARIELAGRVMAVNLLDLSEGGAGIEAPSQFAACGDEGLLVLDTAIVGVRVVGVEDDRIALAFTALSPHAQATIGRIIAESAQPPDA